MFQEFLRAAFYASLRHFPDSESIQVDDFSGFANFEVDSSLAKLLSHTREQLPCFTHALWRHKNLQAIALLFVHSAIIGDPSTLERALQGIAAKRITNKGQERAPL